MYASEFTAMLAKELGESKRRTRKIYRAFLKCMTEKLKKDGLVQFIGFGRLKVRTIAAHTVSNAITTKHVPARNQVIFKGGKDLKAAIN